MRNIKEVWDYRLSTAVPTIYNTPGGTWTVEVHAKAGGEGPLATHDTGVPATPGDNNNREGLDACYAWLRSVRDDYASPDIESLKPKVALIDFVEFLVATALVGCAQDNAGVAMAKSLMDMVKPDLQGFDAGVFVVKFRNLFAVARAELEPGKTLAQVLVDHEALLAGLEDTLHQLAEEAGL